MSRENNKFVRYFNDVLVRPFNQYLLLEVSKCLKKIKFLYYCLTIL